MLKTILAGMCLLCCLLFSLFLSSTSISHHSALLCFPIVEIDSWNQIRSHPGGHISYIIFQSHLLFIQYLGMFFIGLLKWVGGSFPHIVVRWISEDGITRWFSNTLFLEGKNSIICSNFFYIYSCNVVAFYTIYFFSLVARRYLYGGKICLGVVGKVVRAEGG